MLGCLLAITLHLFLVAPLFNYGDAAYEPIQTNAE